MSQDQNPATTTGSMMLNPLAEKIQAALDDLTITPNVPVRVQTLIHATDDLDVTTGMALARTLGLDGTRTRQAEGTRTRWIQGTAADGSRVVIFIGGQPGYGSTQPDIPAAASSSDGTPQVPLAPVAARIQAALDDLGITPSVKRRGEIHAWDLDPAAGMTLARTLDLGAPSLQHGNGYRWITGTTPDGSDVIISISDQPEPTEQPEPTGQPEAGQPEVREADAVTGPAARAAEDLTDAVGRIRAALQAFVDEPVTNSSFGWADFDALRDQAQQVLLQNPAPQDLATAQAPGHRPRWAAEVLAGAVVDAGHYPEREYDDGSGDELCGTCSDACEGVTDWPCPVVQLLTPEVQDLVRAITTGSTTTSTGQETS